MTHAVVGVVIALLPPLAVQLFWARRVQAVRDELLSVARQSRRRQFELGEVCHAWSEAHLKWAKSADARLGKLEAGCPACGSARYGRFCGQCGRGREED